MNNDFLKKLEPQHTREMVDCMYEKIFSANQLVIQEGEPGNYLYVLAGRLWLFFAAFSLIVSDFRNTITCYNVPVLYSMVLGGYTEGFLEVMQNGKLLGQMRPGTAFGELAILYNCKRTATVKGE